MILGEGVAVGPKPTRQFVVNLVLINDFLILLFFSAYSFVVGDLIWTAIYFGTSPIRNPWGLGPRAILTCGGPELELFQFVLRLKLGYPR